jgi:hypothetical protein
MTKQTIINRALINLMDLKNKFSLTNNVSKTYIGVAVIIIDTMCTLLLDEITTLTENSTQEELLDEINITIIKISQLKQ